MIRGLALWDRSTRYGIKDYEGARKISAPHTEWHKEFISCAYSE